MDENQRRAVSEMRGSVRTQLGSSSTQEFGDLTLMRFLIARSMNVEKAAKMFVEWQTWRSSFVPLGNIPVSEIEDELASEKIYLQGLSRKSGRPIVVAKIHRHSVPKDHLQFKKFVVYTLDKSIASGFKSKEIGNEKIVAVLDLNNLSYKNVDVRGMITGFQFLQGYYPERLAKCYILDMPWFFVSAWRLISQFLDKATLEKIVIVRNEEERQEFVEEIGEEVLPEEYGGRAKLVLLQDYVLPPLDD
ncbi:sec14 cytosolic factor-like [Andrographis paniculata]|uniref:sec14 cytosolic factor-like n=1 Tax=Andrographis paniculata TaxID=175694 RepID=UPI0021E99E90|nr:sec14 cytosolic factor-like [Andrographis paniculata]